MNELEQSTGEKKGMILRMYDVKNMFTAQGTRDKGFAARDKWFAATQRSNTSEQHKGDGSKRE